MTDETAELAKKLAAHELMSWHLGMIVERYDVPADFPVQVLRKVRLVAWTNNPETIALGISLDSAYTTHYVRRGSAIMPDLDDPLTQLACIEIVREQYPLSELFLAKVGTEWMLIEHSAPESDISVIGIYGHPASATLVALDRKLNSYE